MEESFPLLFAAVIGFTHAFEADHLVAVSSIVTRRDQSGLAIKDGIFWGLGHTSTILLIGGLLILGKLVIPEQTFGMLEGLVGVMLICLGAFRLWKFLQAREEEHTHHHRLAYGVGLIHGLAGSGAMVLLVMSNLASAWSSMLYLMVFGLGSVAGMLVAAGLFSLPFSKRWARHPMVQPALIWGSALLCIGYGSWVIYEQATALTQIASL
ncbi:MAG: urease accessory protein [Bacteroidota bacterium]